MQRFTIPRDLYFGENAIDHLKEVKGKKAIIVIGSERLINNGTVPKVQANLKEAGVESIVYSGVENDPTVAVVEAGVAKMNEYNPDLIVAIGGGSPIDAAKAMWIFYEHPELSFEEATKPFSLPALRNKAKFIAIATTSGTATEVTSFSVIADTETGIKYPIADYNVTPDVAILDTNLVQSLSPSLVANTGMDALTHAIEAYVSTAATPITDACAEKAIVLIRDYLAKAVENGHDEEARDKMAYAEYLAGMAFNNASLGYVHAIAHQLGGFYNLPHGVCNAILLPHVQVFNSQVAAGRLKEVAHLMGVKVEGLSDKDGAAKCIDAIKALSKQVGIPAGLEELGVKKADFPTLTKNALKDVCGFTNPIKANDADIIAILESAF